MIVPLREAGDATRFGGKAAGLAAALGAGLPVPDGVALSVEGARAVSQGDPAALRALHALLPRGPYAVRSSAIGEDGAAASFAGQHRTELGAPEPGLAAAVARVVASAGASAPYRQRLGLHGGGMAVVVQPVVPAEVAGVLFTVDPVSGADVLVLEAAYGLGEAVVAGRVTPDHWRLDRGGAVLGHHPGSRDVRLVLGEDGVVEEPVPADLAWTPPLDGAALAEVAGLVARLDALWPGPHDVELAWVRGDLVLLQRRPVTVRR